MLRSYFIMRIFIFCFAIVNLISISKSFAQISLILPKNNWVQTDTIVNFSWNICNSNDEYELQISTSYNFTSFETYNISKTDTSLSFYTGKYFVRYRCISSTNWSNIRQFTIIDLNLFSNLVLWLDANKDLSVIKDATNNVSSWINIADNGIFFQQSNTNFQPKWIASEPLLNNKSLLTFDGVNDFLSAGDTLDIGSNSVSFFIIAKSNASIFSRFFSKALAAGVNNRFSLGHSNSGNLSLIYHDNVQREITFTNSTKYRNYSFVSNRQETNSVARLFSKGEQVGSTIAIANSNYNFNSPYRFLIGAYNNSSDDGQIAYLNGDIAEFIMFHSSLNDSIRKTIEQYLRFKYTPPINLGADIYKDYGFCDTTISAYKPWFTSYLWNTNETDSIISVDSSGFYSVTVTDIFGFTSYDSVYVKYPGNINEYNNSLFCSNDSILINTNLSHDGYTFLWSNNLTDSAIYVKNGELLSLTITDSLGCFRSQTIEIFEDTLARINIFPNSDTSLCSNNFLTPELNAFSPLDFFWSTSQTTSSIIINNSDNYSVTVTNENGCQAIDTIFVHVVGEAPTPLFSADTVCLGFPTTFTDQSFSTDLSNINYWHWDFGDGSSDVTQHPQHTYNQFGVFDVTLTLETDSGCGNKIIKKVLVNRIPEFDFNISYSQPCTGENYPISFSGEDHLNTISEWQWTFENANAANFDDNSDSDVAHIYQNADTYFSRLVVWDDNGCTDTAFKKLVIYPTPQPDFVYTPDCEGKTSAFTDNTPNAATNWNWQWNATGISGNIGSTPMFSYNFLNGGGYNVTMTVQTPQQCVAQTVKNIFIPKKPNVQFSITDFCINTPIQVFDESTVLNSYPVKWHWNVLNHPNESSEQHPNFTFPEQNNLNKYSLRLVVESVEGCKDSITKIITVHEEPTADFTFNPKFGQPPLEVNFSNQSSEDVISYHWSFGDNQFSDLENPVHLYVDSAVYDIQLKVNNEFGCADSTAKFIKVLLPTLDLAIANAKSSLVNDRYLTITANIINLGTRAVFDFDLFLVSSDNVVIREVWEGELLTNQVIPYQFTASFDTEQQTTPKYICVKVDHPNGEQDENMSNNEYCLTFSDFTVFDPYPNPTFETLNLLIIIPKNSNIEIKLLNQIGQEVRNLYSGQLNKGIQKFDYDISTLRNGIYTLKFSNGEEVILKTFIKQ
jgi:PKD repeat protein